MLVSAPNWAVIWPEALRRLDPDTTMVCPADPLAGWIEFNTGPDPAFGVAAVVVVVVAGCVVVVTDVVPGDGAAAPLS